MSALGLEPVNVGWVLGSGEVGFSILPCEDVALSSLTIAHSVSLFLNICNY